MGTTSLDGQIGMPMSMELSRLHKGRAQSKERAKCSHAPQVSATISTRINSTDTSSKNHSTRPLSALTSMSMRTWVPSRWT